MNFLNLPLLHLHTYVTVRNKCTLAKGKEKSMHNYYKSRPKWQKQNTGFLVLICNKIVIFMQEKSLKQRVGKVQLRWESWLGKKARGEQVRTSGNI